MSSSGRMERGGGAPSATAAARSSASAAAAAAAAAAARTNKHIATPTAAAATPDDDELMDESDGEQQEEEEALGSASAGESATPAPSRIPPGHPRSLWTEGYAYGVRILSDRVSVRYVQRAMHQLDVGTVRSAEAVPKAAAAPVWYFEMRVLSAGHKQQMAIGIAPLHSPCLFAPADMHARESSVSASASRSHHGTASHSCTQVGMDGLSYGYRGDEGHKFHGPTVVAGRSALNGAPYGPAFGAGDVVGCGVNYYDGSVFFTHNGRNLGAAFHLKPEEWARADPKGNGARSPSAQPIDARMDLYAVVSLHSKGEHVKCNFGQTPFMFDVAAFQEAERQRVQRQISATPFDNSLMLPLIRSYLLHQGYEKSLEALNEMSSGMSGSASSSDAPAAAAQSTTNGKDGGQAASASSASASTAAAAAATSSSSQTRHDAIAARTLHERRVIRELIEGGDIEAAMTAISQLTPSLWSNPSLTSLSSPLTAQQLQLRLLSLHFISLLGSTSATRVLDAIAFAQRQLLPFQSGGDDRLRADVEQLMGLLAYPDVASSPLAHLLGVDYRVETADHVNALLLTSLCTPPRSAANVHGVSSLQLLLRHALAVDGVLKQQAFPLALPNLLDPKD